MMKRGPSEGITSPTPSKQFKSEFEALQKALDDGDASQIESLYSGFVKEYLIECINNKQNLPKLAIAVIAGHTSLVEDLIKQENIDNSFAEGLTPLALAALCGQTSMVKLLIDKGADVNKSLDGKLKGTTPICLAVFGGHIETIQLLFQNGAALKVNDEHKRLLEAAVNFNHFEVAKFLIENGADVNHADTSGHTPLHCAASKRHIEIAAHLIENKADVDCVTNGNFPTPLHWASYNGDVAMVKLLLNNGASIMLANENGWTPLHWAAYEGHVDVVEYLIHKGAIINQINMDGDTALDLTIDRNHIPVFKILIDGTFIDKPNEDRFTRLHSTAQKGRVELVKLLVKKGVNLHKGDKNGWTALHWAAFEGHTDVVEYLIRMGANVNHLAKDKSTALILATYEYHTPVIKLLVENGANIDAVNDDGYTALHISAQKGQIKIAKFLIDMGASIDKRCVYLLNNPLHLAAVNGHEKTVKFLIGKGYPYTSKGNIYSDNIQKIFNEASEIQMFISDARKACTNVWDKLSNIVSGIYNILCPQPVSLECDSFKLAELNEDLFKLIYPVRDAFISCYYNDCTKNIDMYTRNKMVSELAQLIRDDNLSASTIDGLIIRNNPLLNLGQVFAKYQIPKDVAKMISAMIPGHEILKGHGNVKGLLMSGYDRQIKYYNDKAIAFLKLNSMPNQGSEEESEHKKRKLNA